MAEKIKNYDALSELTLECYDDSITTLDNYINNICNRVLNFAKEETIMITIMAGSNARLNNFDEKILLSYRKILDCYGRVVDAIMQSKNRIVTESIFKIVCGIEDVLISRQALFEDKNRHSKINYIKDEKKEILKLSTINTSEKLEEVSKFIVIPKDNIRKKLFDGFGYNQSLNLICEIQNYLKEGCFEDFYNTYLICAQKCIYELKDINKRVELRHYLELFSREQEILSALIKVQVNALEEEISSKSASEYEKKLVESIIIDIKETYQISGKDYADISGYFNSSSGIKGEITFLEPNEFIVALSERTAPQKVLSEKLYSKIEKIYLKSYVEFCTSLDSDIENYLKYELIKWRQKEISESVEQLGDKYIYLSGELIKIFIYVCKYKEKNFIEIDENEINIVNGILESIEIKISCLKESEDDFKKWCEDLTDNNKNVIFDMDVYSNFVCRMHELLIKEIFICKSENTNKEISFEKIINECGEDFLEEAKKWLTQEKEEKILKIKVKISGLLKEFILYEVSTFEEIINFSLLKLYSSINSEVGEFVCCVKNAQQQVSKLLTDYGIEFIRPFPHEVFNGREHEVLLAEENENFTRGEIIKLINSGYKFGGLIILRANVIAAR